MDGPWTGHARRLAQRALRDVRLVRRADPADACLERLWEGAGKCHGQVVEVSRTGRGRTPPMRVPE